MRKILFAVIVLALFITNSVFALEPMLDEDLNVSGYLKNKTDVNVIDGHLMRLQNIFELAGEFKIEEFLYLFAKGRYYYDAVYDIEDRYKNTRGIDMRQPGDEWLRAAYIDYISDKLDIRLGKQEVIWGTADGVKILDKINPINYRYWTLDDEHLPLWMLKVEYSPITDGTIQLLAIPDYETNFVPPAGSPWAMRTSEIGERGLQGLQQIPGMNISLITDKPEKRAENTKAGLRWLSVINGFEYTLNYFYGYNYSQTAYSYMTLTWVGFPVFDYVPSGFTLISRYEPINIAGASFSKTLSGNIWDGLTIRGEFAHVNNNKINYGQDQAIIAETTMEGWPVPGKVSDVGVVAVDEYNYCMGFDKYLWTNWLFSFQVIQFITVPRADYGKDRGNVLLFGPTRGPLDEMETMLSLKVSTDFMHARLKPEVLILYGDDNDWKISPKISYDISDDLMVTAGAHIFDGEPSQLSGQFSDHDLAFMELKYGF
ncbi:MAG: DUF1302 family protein [Candidatus Omnitrophota bacterium]|nr:DUF1302 family protein [Candidatus Omnitrophota bacterium]